MKDTIKQHNIERNEEKGSVMALAAVSMVAFILAAGLAVDISHLYVIKAELQNAVDAAALSGASRLNSSSRGITEATDNVVNLVNNYEFNKKRIQFQRSNVEFATNLDGPYMSEASAKASSKTIRFIRVSSPDVPVGLFFTANVTKNPLNVKATAVAGQSVPLNVICDWIPLSVIDDDVNTILPGNLYTIRAAPGNKVSPGNYQILAVSGRGGKDVREDLAEGIDQCMSPGDMVDTKPGVTAGPVRQGLNTRFDEYSGGTVNPTDHPPDTNIKEGITYSQYLEGTSTQSPSNQGLRGRRVVIIPIIKKGEFDNGRDQVRIDRFGAFFLQDKVAGGNGGDIQAEYIGEPVSMGRGGYNPNGPTPNPLLTMIVLYK
jgi:Flp pilus assembly protein TadG